jgi:hypothetical protein
MMMALDRRGAVHVLDKGLGRRTILDAKGKVLSSSRYPADFFSRDFYVTGGGEIVVSANVRQPSAIGFSFHRTAADKIVSSFGPEVAIAPRSNKDIVRYTLTSAAKGGFWALRFQELQLELRRDDGTLLKVLAGKLDWMPMVVEPVPSSPTTPAQPRFVALSERGDGLLVLSALVAGERWKEAWGPPIANPYRSPGGPTTYRTMTNPELAYAVKLVVVDPTREEVLSTDEFDRNVIGFADSDHIVSFAVRNEEPVVRIWKIVFTRGGGTQ